jgi:hypothetical protein
VLLLLLILHLLCLLCHLVVHRWPEPQLCPLVLVLLPLLLCLLLYRSQLCL